MPVDRQWYWWARSLFYEGRVHLSHANWWIRQLALIGAHYSGLKLFTQRFFCVPFCFCVFLGQEGPRFDTGVGIRYSGDGIGRKPNVDRCLEPTGCFSVSWSTWTSPSSKLNGKWPVLWAFSVIAEGYERVSCSLLSHLSLFPCYRLCRTHRESWGPN